MAKQTFTETSLPGLEDPRIAGLPEGVKAPADALLLAAGSGDEAAHEEAFRRFLEGVFIRPELVAEGAAFLARAYEGREEWLARHLGTPELVQEMATGQALLTCVAAGEWVARRDFTRLLRLAEGMLAARMHLRSADCLDLMLAMASTLAVMKQQKAAALVSHVEERRREGVTVDETLLAEARHRLTVADVVGAANQATREMWDQRLLQPGREWTWTSDQERQALRDLAEWLPRGHAACADFARIVPVSWWDLWEAWQPRQEAATPDEELRNEPAAVEAAAWTGGLLTGESAEEPAEARLEDPVEELRLRLGWFVAGGVIGALAAVLLQVFSSEKPGENGPREAESVGTETVRAGETALGSGVQGSAALTWCREERERLAEELVHVGRLGAVRAAGWGENAAFLTGLTPDLPSQSQMYRKMLTLLHLDPPQDAETRAMVPRLLLRRGADEQLVSLWERCLEAGLGMRPEIAAAAREALDQPALNWTAEQRERLRRLGRDQG